MLTAGDNMKEWKRAAERLFFECHKKIVDIAEELQVSRQWIATYLRSLPGYTAETERRKNKNAEKRRYTKMVWMRDSRTEAAILRREHEQAVRELSAERYH